MKNREKIEKFCKENNVVILSLDFIRNTDAEYENTTDASYWDLETIIDGEKEHFDSFNGYDVDMDIDLMLESITDTIKENLSQKQAKKGK